MKRLLSLSFIVLLALGVRADEWLWVGGSDPLWTSDSAPYANQNGNWKNLTDETKGGYPNSADDIAVFDGDARLRCANDPGQQKFGGLKIKSGTVEFLSVYNGSRAIQFAAPTNVIDIAEGAALKLTQGPSIAGVEADRQVVVLTGKGSFSWSGNSVLGDRQAGGCRLKDFLIRDFHDGAFEIGSFCNVDSILVFHLASGMTAFWPDGVDNRFENTCVVRVDKGATFDMNNRSDVFGAFTGEGDVLNVGTLTLSLPGAKGPFAFGGRCEGRVQVLSNSTVLTDNSYILLTATEAFAGTTFTSAPSANGSFLRFAPGVGTFAVKNYIPTDGQRLVLEDTDGNPVVVKTELGTTLNETVTGSGDLVYVGTADVTYGNTALNHSGKIGVTSGTVNLGNSNAANDPPLDRYAGLFVEAPGKLKIKNGAPVTITGEITGNGQLEASGPGEWTSFRKTGGAFYNSSALIWTNPAAMMDFLAYWPNASVAVKGGLVEGVGHDFLQINGGENTSLSISDGAVVKGKNLTVSQLSVSNAVLNIYGGLGNTGSQAAPQVIRLDGATVRLGSEALVSSDSMLGTRDDAAYRRVYVKEGGATVYVAPPHQLYGYSIGRFQSETAEGVKDGGVTVTGPGWLRLDGAMDITGPLRFLGGFARFNVAGFDFPGDVEIGCGRLDELSGSSIKLASGAGSTVTLSGGNTLAPHVNGLITFGAEGAATDSVFTRRPGGVLFVESTASSPKLAVNGGIADTSAGVAKMPIFTFTERRGDAGAETSRKHLQFTSLADGGLTEVYGTAWAGSDSTEGVALVDSADETVVASDASVGGIRLFGRNGSALTVPAGVRLSVGDGKNPAAILLNNSHASGRGKAIVSGEGTIDFGGSEGVIAFNLIQSNMLETEVNCSIAGRAGLTIAAPSELGWIKLGGANTYSGGTYIENASVSTVNGSSFGTGPVTVAYGPFAGGEVRFEATATYANDFNIGGWGSRQESKINSEGALWFVAPAVTLNGAVTLHGETRIGGGVNGMGVLTQPVTGNGPLFVRGEATVVFGSANTFTGGLTIADGATVTVREGATLGADAVVVDGTLRLENASDIVIPNVVSGKGTIILAGAGKVSFANRRAFTGSIRTEGGAFDLAGTDVTVGYLDGTGDLQNSGAAATITVDGSHLASFGGTIDGAVSFVKTGDSAQALTGLSTYTGATRVERGTLRLGAYESFASLPVTDNVLRLDAGAGVMTVDSASNEVESWADADGKDFVFVNTLPKAGEPPARATVETRACGPAIAFAAKTWVRLCSENSLADRTIFSVFNVINQNARQDYFAEMIGATGQDSGVRLAGGGFVDQQKDWIDGVSGSIFTQDALHLFTREYATANVSAKTSVSGYSGYRRPWNGDLHEIVVYDRTLTETERESVNDYLMVKWGLRAAKITEKLVNVLPATTDLTVDEDGTLDLAGNDQTLASLVCAGSVTNASTRVATLTLTGDSVIAPGAFFGGETLNVNLAAGVTLDLGGGTFTIRHLEKNGGRVINGKFIQTKPWRPFVFIVR